MKERMAFIKNDEGYVDLSFWDDYYYVLTIQDSIRHEDISIKLSKDELAILGNGIQYALGEEAL